MRHGRCQGLSLLATLLLLAAGLPRDVDGISLFDKLNSSSLVSQFAQVLWSSGLGVQMQSGTCSNIRCFVVFAPTNTAMTTAYPSGFSSIDKAALVTNHFLSAFQGSTKGLLSAWPSLGTPVGQDIGFGQVQIVKTSSSTLFWLGKSNGGTWSYRINNAAIIVDQSNQDADNGVYHVLDQVVLPIGSQTTVNDFLAAPNSAISQQLSISKSLTIFSEWMKRDTDKNYLYDAFKSSSVYKVRTLFLPSNSAWDRIPASVMQHLNSSIPDYRKVLVAHFAPDICVFTSWMTLGSSINFNVGHSDVQQYGAKMYMNSMQNAFVSVGGVVAQFVDKSINYPIGDTVIHVVDRVLAFASDTLASLAQTNAPAFYAQCITVPSCQALLTANDTQRTLFAPDSIVSLNGVSSTRQEQILLLHFVPRIISKPDMNESDIVTAQNSSGEIRFRMAANGTRCFVEGRLPGRGFVRAELTMYDQPAKNGIFHKITYPMGQPMQTVQEFVNSFPDLSSVSPYMGSNSFDPNLGTAGSYYTVFPPNNAAMQAFSAYKSGAGANVGKSILGSMTLRDRVFRRMVLPNQMIIVDVAPAGINEYPTANTVEYEKVTLNLMGPAGLRTRTAQLTGVSVMTSVSLAAGEYECTNGMVYPVSFVLFRDSDIEGYTRSARPVTSSLAVAVLTVLLVCLAWI